MNSIELIPPTKTVSGSVQLGGSKSYTNRALILAALAEGRSKLTSVSLSDDSTVLITALSQLGISISFIGKTTVEVMGNGGHFASCFEFIDVGHAGTAMRFLTAFCCLVPGEILLDGSSRMRERPIKDLINALRTLGASIQYLKNEGSPPILIKKGVLSCSSVVMSGKVSSQFISALLLIGSILSQGLEINITDEQISKSYIDMTIDSLKTFGVMVQNDAYKRYSIDRLQKLKATQYQVEGDASGASYLFSLAAISEGTVTVKNINPHSAQGDVHFVDLLEKMGCKVVKNTLQNSITVIGPPRLHGISVDMELMPDTAQTLAVVAAFAHGSTYIQGLSTLRIKETDRIEATKRELKKMEIKCDSTDDSITIHGGVPHPASIKTYNDHRMAMAFSVAGAVLSGMRIENPEVVNKSFPDYWERITELGVNSKLL